MFGVPSGVLLGAVVLGAIHGAEPGHGWPVAAAYAADRANRWLAGAVAGLVIGAGHLVSSLAVVGLFFLVKRQFAVGTVTEPLRVGGVTVGSPLGIVAGVLLIALGVREYRSDGHGHSHGHGGHAHGDAGDHAHSHSDDHEHSASHEHSHEHTDDHDHGHEHTGGHEDDHSHGHNHAQEHDHSHDNCHSDDHADDNDHSHGHGGLDATDGLWGIAVSAFVLGFAHEEEFEIIAICAGTDACLPAMTAYALTVVAVITLATLALVAGFEQFEERAERAAAALPTLSAAVLVLLGIGFLLGIV